MTKPRPNKIVEKIEQAGFAQSNDPSYIFQDPLYGGFKLNMQSRLSDSQNKLNWDIDYNANHARQNRLI
ncbi:unnamed protein product [Fusarium graminearum]|nr:unnamed protein product [Fusarium graminearum]